MLVYELGSAELSIALLLRVDGERGVTLLPRVVSIQDSRLELHGLVDGRQVRDERRLVLRAGRVPSSSLLLFLLTWRRSQQISDVISTELIDC